MDISCPVDKSQTLATRSFPPENILSAVTSTLSTALACPSATWRHVNVGAPPEEELDICRPKEEGAADVVVVVVDAVELPPLELRPPSAMCGRIMPLPILSATELRAFLPERRAKTLPLRKADGEAGGVASGVPIAHESPLPP